MLTCVVPHVIILRCRQSPSPRVPHVILRVATSSATSASQQVNRLMCHATSAATSPGQRVKVPRHHQPIRSCHVAPRVVILRCRQSLSPRVATSATRHRHVSQLLRRNACQATVPSVATPMAMASRRWPENISINRAQNFGFQCTFFL